MTIYLYSGTPGSGKSLHAASDCRSELNRRNPRPIIANFPLADDARVTHRDLFRYVPNDAINTRLLMDFADEWWASHRFRENGIILILDEAQILFNSRNWTSKTRLAWLSFFSQHRKYGFKVIFIAQSAKMIDNQFRMLCEFDCNHRKVSNMGLFGFLVSLPFAFRLFVFVTYYFQSDERISRRFYVYKRRDSEMYDSYRRFEGNADTKRFEAAAAID